MFARGSMSNTLLRHVIIEIYQQRVYKVAQQHELHVTLQQLGFVGVEISPGNQTRTNVINQSNKHISVNIVTTKSSYQNTLLPTSTEVLKYGGTNSCSRQQFSAEQISPIGGGLQPHERYGFWFMGRNETARSAPPTCLTTFKLDYATTI